MKRSWFMLGVAAAASLLLASACSPIRTVTPLPVATLPPIIAPTIGSPSGDAVQPSQENSSTSVSPSSGQNGPVALEILSPQDGTVVNASQIEVSGRASPGAVVTVNDNILIVGADGQFTTVISLDEGPNLIEVIASNDSGSELSVELTVTYEP